MLYALQNFRHYLLGGHCKMYTDHYALRYLVKKPVLGGNMQVAVVVSGVLFRSNCEAKEIKYRTRSSVVH